MLTRELVARFRPLSRRGISAAVAIAMLLSSIVASSVSADPAADALARLNELSRVAEQTTESVHAAQIDLDAKLSAQSAADRRQVTAQAALAAARNDQAGYQLAVDEIAAAMYMGGRPDGLSAALTADSPRQLIDELSVQRVMATEMSSRMQAFKQANQRAVDAARASSDSAAAARDAAEQAATVRAKLQAKQNDLLRQIEQVKAQYAALTPQQQAVLADPGPPPPPAATNPAVIAMPPEPFRDAAPPSLNEASGGQNSVVVQAALTQLGKPYSWGATGPDAFDCSGLIQWAFLQTGKKLPRTSQALASGGQPVAVENLQPGDIVTFYSDVSHAGIYIGDGLMVHASTFGTPVKVAPISTTPFNNARRY